MSDRAAELIEIIEDLTGQRAPLVSGGPERALALLDDGEKAIGYSQLNELLLLMGYDRVTHEFFQYLVDGGTYYSPGTALSSLEQLREGAERFQKLALLLYGNVKFGFKQLSRDVALLNSWLWSFSPREEEEFAARHNPIQPLIPISGEDSYFLGYLVQRELARRLHDCPEDKEAQDAEARRHEIVKVGIKNHETYLASDHLDVYVATSMRERHEYLFVHDLTQQIFGQERLAKLKLRWFDPTQAYCHDRIDKGLSEALMLKRAKCTLYFAQETDTLGKDSELASTLAQGKTVIAFVPDVDSLHVDHLLAKLKKAYPGKPERTLLMEQLRIFEPDAAWKDPDVRGWLDSMPEVDLDKVKRRLLTSISNHYDRRARMLKEDHPLGIQVNLGTGVANGVLVVRTVDDCAELIRRVITRDLKFSLDANNCGYIFLREEVSGCIFRVMTGDAMLTNAFWNFYLED